jgi:aspartate aminotransferase
MKVNLPQGAFYFFPEIKSFFGKTHGKYNINNSNDLCMYLLHEAHVALVPGDAFGDPDCIRFSYATATETLIEAVRRIKEALALLK